VQCFTSPTTQYRLYGRRFFTGQKTQPTVSNVLKEKDVKENNQGNGDDVGLHNSWDLRDSVEMWHDYTQTETVRHRQRQTERYRPSIDDWWRLGLGRRGTEQMTLVFFWRQTGLTAHTSQRHMGQGIISCHWQGTVTPTDTFHRLTLWRPLLPYGYSYEASCAKPSFVIFDIWVLLTLRTEHQSAQMSKSCKWRFGTGCFIAVPIRQQWASKG